MNFNPYEVLGLHTEATLAEIKIAYHNKARETHPDTGGDRDEFEQIQQSWEILSDPVKRKAYDEGGFVEGALNSNFENNAIERVTEFFVQIIEASVDQIDLNQLDFVQGGTLYFNKRIDESHNHIFNCNKKIAHYERVMKRLKCKKQNDILKKTLTNHLSNYKRMANGHQLDIKINKRAIEILKDYEFVQSGLLLRGWSIST